MNHKLLQQALDALNGGLYRSDSIVKAIEALEAELAKPEPRNDAAWHWHDLYKAKCQEFHDKQTMLGTEIVALEEELEELKEEQLEQEPVAQIRIKNGYWIDTPRSAKVKSLPDGLHDLYTAPTKRDWVGLTDKERNEMIGKIQHDQFTRQRDLIGSTQIITEMYLKERNI